MLLSYLEGWRIFVASMNPGNKMTEKRKKHPKQFKVIEIDKEYKLYIDNFNVILQYKKASTLSRGGVVQSDNQWKDLGYYSSIPSALWAYCKHTVRQQDDIKGILDRLSKLEDMFNNLIKIPKFNSLNKPYI